MDYNTGTLVFVNKTIQRVCPVCVCGVVVVVVVVLRVKKKFQNITLVLSGI